MEMDKYFTDEEMQNFRKYAPKGASEEDLTKFFHAIERTGLDPLARQIYLLPRGGKHMIVVGIDGYRLIADRTEKYAGCDKAEFDMDGESIVAAHVTIYKMVEGVRCGFTGTARWAEYNANGGMWKSMPYGQLAKCAEALALRKGFPANYSGIYVMEELDQERDIDNQGDTYKLNKDIPENPEPGPEFRAEPGIIYDGQLLEFKSPQKKEGQKWPTPGFVKVNLMQGGDDETVATCEKSLSFFRFPEMVDEDILKAVLENNTPIQVSFTVKEKGQAKYENLGALVVNESLSTDNQKNEIKKMVDAIAAFDKATFDATLEAQTGMKNIDEIDGMFPDEVQEILDDLSTQVDRVTAA